MEWSTTTARSRIKTEILEKKLIPYECDICKLGDWLSTPISLHLDHIDGVNNNNKLSNLRFLCPNCHSQTETYCGKQNKTRYSVLNKKVSDAELLTSIRNSATVKEALTNAGLSGASNYDRVYRLAKQHGIQHIITKEEKVQIIIGKLKAVNIDTTKFGWVQQVATIIGIAPQKTRGWLEKNYPEYLNGTTHRRKTN